jgi:hypothetical protein
VRLKILLSLVLLLAFHASWGIFFVKMLQFCQIFDSTFVPDAASDSELPITTVAR